MDSTMLKKTVKNIQEQANVKTEGVKADTENNADTSQLRKDVIEESHVKLTIVNTNMGLEEPNIKTEKFSSKTN